MSEVMWKDPPPPQQNRSGQPRKWVRILTPLMEHPKRWALVRTFDRRQGANALQSALNKPNGAKGACITPPGRWEFTSRQTPTGSDLYARYLGPEDES